MSMGATTRFMEHHPFHYSLRGAAREPSAERRKAFLLLTRHLCLGACYALRATCRAIISRPAGAGLDTL